MARGGRGSLAAKMAEFGTEDFGDNDDDFQALPTTEAPKKKKKKKKAAPMVEETDNPLFPMGESKEKGDGRLDGLDPTVKDDLNQGLSQLQDFVSTTMKTDEEQEVGAYAPMTRELPHHLPSP